MENNQTQCDVIARHLREVGPITSFEAFGEYGITRLSDVIYKLKKRGHNIVTEDVTRKNRYGQVVHFGKYIEIFNGGN